MTKRDKTVRTPRAGQRGEHGVAPSGPRAKSPRKDQLEPISTEGRRNGKQRETRLRIAEIGLQLFDERGYDATTLEQVAKAADVSPRALYHYFKTKYDILLFWHDAGFTAEIGPTILLQCSAEGPFAVARACLLALVPRYETDRLAAVDRVWNSTEALLASKQLIYVNYENAVAAGLAQVWPAPEREPLLRVIAVMVVGALRLAMEAGRQSGETRPLVDRLRDRFALLEQSLGSAAAIAG